MEKFELKKKKKNRPVFPSGRWGGGGGIRGFKDLFGKLDIPNTETLWMHS